MISRRVVATLLNRNALQLPWIKWYCWYSAWAPWCSFALVRRAYTFKFAFLLNVDWKDSVIETTCQVDEIKTLFTWLLELHRGSYELLWNKQRLFVLEWPWWVIFYNFRWVDGVIGINGRLGVNSSSLWIRWRYWFGYFGFSLIFFHYDALLCLLQNSACRMTVLVVCFNSILQVHAVNGIKFFFINALREATFVKWTKRCVLVIRDGAFGGDVCFCHHFDRWHALRRAHELRSVVVYKHALLLCIALSILWCLLTKAPRFRAPLRHWKLLTVLAGVDKSVDWNSLAVRTALGQWRRAWKLLLRLRVDDNWVIT